MTEASKSISKKELAKAKKMLEIARNKYENELIKMEKVWANLKPNEYLHRESMVKVATEMAEIGQSLKFWESKLNT